MRQTILLYKLGHSQLYTLGIFSLSAETEPEAPYKLQDYKHMINNKGTNEVCVCVLEKDNILTLCSLKDLQTVLFKITSGGIETDKLANIINQFTSVYKQTI